MHLSPNVRSRGLSRALALAVALVVALPLIQLPGEPASGAATPVATDDPTYEAFGRVFPDPHGCFVHGDTRPPDGSPTSPWAKGNVCATDYLAYTEALEGTRYLARRFPDLVEVLEVEDAWSAGIARPVALENGDVELLGRDRSKLYMFKVTDERQQEDLPEGEQGSFVPESEREHFVFSMSIHGLERAGLEGGIRAMEDLVTWAACERDEYAGVTPACTTEGPFPKEIVEGDTDRPVPTAGETLKRSVIYFIPTNPDGWRYGQKRAFEIRDGDPNANFVFGPSHSRYNGHGVDLNRDWPTVGYTYKPHQPWSEPETSAFGEALLDIRDRTADKRFAGGIDLHGMLTASAFSYTLLGADQRDYRKNAITVETSLRTWEDQTQRLTWSPYIGDSDGDGEQDREAIIPVADQWGTVYDTLGYTVTGAMGFWIDDSRIGLGGVGINNEMALSHIAPNNVYEPALIQTHIDGNKGLIYSQLSALLYEQEAVFDPPGRIGYVENPARITNDGSERPQNPGLPAQADFEVVLPCRNDLQPQLPNSCGDGTFSNDGTDLLYEFEVKGPEDGFWNGGMTITSTAAEQFVGHQAYVHAGVEIEYFDESHGDSGEWHTVKDLSRTNTTLNDPAPGRWRIRMSAAPSMPRRVEFDFDPVTAEEDPGQISYDVANTDFFEDLNIYAPADEQIEALSIADVVDGATLNTFDTVVVANDLGRRGFLTGDEADGGLALDPADADAYFAALDAFARGGGNLVLTDAALSALPEFTLVEQDTVQQRSGLAGFYAFRTDSDTITYEDPDTYPLARDVDQPGAAEPRLGDRQAVEPPTLGFSPDGDSHARMPFWGVEREAWEANCEKDQPIHCTTAATSSQGSLASVGEVAHGEGVVRIVGALLPDPNPVNDSIADHRFGLGAYALTWTAYEVFENLVDHRNPNREDPQDEPEPVATTLTYTGDRQVQGNEVELAAVLETVEGAPVADRTLRFEYGDWVGEAVTDATGEARTTAPVASGREATVTVTFEGDDAYGPSSTDAVLRRGGGGQDDQAGRRDGRTEIAAAGASSEGNGPVLFGLVLIALISTWTLRRRLSSARHT